MKPQKSTKKHLSTQKNNKSFQKPHNKQRQKSKNLYTLNKQSQQDEQISYEVNMQSLSKRYGDQNQNNMNDDEINQDSYMKQYGSGQQSNQGSQYYQVNIKKKSYKLEKKAQEQQKQESQQQEYEQNNTDLDNDSLSQNQDNQQQYNKNIDGIKKYFPSIQDEQEILQLNLKNKHLIQQNQILNHSLMVHQNRQKQMISKYAKLQAQNKKLKYQITKIKKSDNQKKYETKKIKENKQQLNKVKKYYEKILEFIQSQNVRIVQYLRGLINKLLSQNMVPEKDQNGIIKKQKKSIGSYLEKCLESLKESRNVYTKMNQGMNGKDQSQEGKQNNQLTVNLKNMQQKNSLIFSYQSQRIKLLSQQNQRLLSQLSKLKQSFTKLSQNYKLSQHQKQSEHKNQKKQLCQKYNSLLEEIKKKCIGLENKVIQQQQKYEIKINQLQKVLAQKQKVIKKLKQNLKLMDIKLEQFQEERFQMIKRNSIATNKEGIFSKKKYVNGDYSILEQSDQDLMYLKNHHQESFYEYQPNKKRKNPIIKQSQNMINLNETSLGLMRKSHKSKRKQFDSEFEKQEKDLEKINNEIEQLEKQILMEFQNQS